MFRPLIFIGILFPKFQYLWTGESLTVRQVQGGRRDTWCALEPVIWARVSDPPTFSSIRLHSVVVE